MESTLSAETLVLDPALEEASQPYVGRWNRLVSTTNWEKGRIISQWRDALQDAQAPPAQSSDEAWSRLVGGVTGQHAGRLRRVYQRFGQVYMKYGGLYWSHFQAALDWSDAEMWLEGAVQSLWSVSQMRNKRWETLEGASAETAPPEGDAVLGELDEDFEPAQNREPLSRTLTGTLEEVSGPPTPEGPDFGDEEERRGSRGDSSTTADTLPNDSAPVEYVQPFANLAELPDDLAEAFECYKLAILRHKAEKWERISRDDVLGSLDALKQLALAPSDDGSPF